MPETVVVVMRHEWVGGTVDTTRWGVFSTKEAARRELGIRVRGSWNPSDHDEYVEMPWGVIYTLSEHPVQE